MDIAFIKHAEHDIHGDDGGKDQQQRIVKRRLKGERCTLETGLHAGGKAQLLLGGMDGGHRIAQRIAGRQIEGNRRRRKLGNMIDGELGRLFRDVGNRR